MQTFIVQATGLFSGQNVKPYLYLTLLFLWITNTVLLNKNIFAKV
jgi:hypothetical protein